MLVKILLIISVSLGFYTEAAWNVTCDFDLDGIEDIIQYLPNECQEIYRNAQAPELYRSSLDEARKFAKFYKTLEQYERQESSTPPNELPKPNWKLRFEIYNKTMLHTCVMDIGNRTDLSKDSERMIEYYDCLSEKRNQMISKIPSEILLWDIVN